MRVWDPTIIRIAEILLLFPISAVMIYLIQRYRGVYPKDNHESE